MSIKEAPHNLRGWLSPDEAAAELGLGLSTIRLMIRTGRLPARRLRGSRLLRVSRADLEAVLEPHVPVRVR